MQQLLQRQRRLLGSDPSSRSVNGSRSKNPPEFVGEASFDTNMVIILAALLFAIIGALGVNSILRCALRCCRSFTTEGEEEAEEREAAAALKKRELGRIPVVVYGKRGSIKGTECPICLSEFEDGDKVRILPQCHHGFHARCIDTWFISHSSCPNCRHSLFEQPTATDSDLNQPQDGSSSIRQTTSSFLVIEGRS